MSIDMYGEKVASASALIREFAKQDYFHYFADGDVEGKLESFIAMMDSCREEGHVKGRGEALVQLQPQWQEEKERADAGAARIAELEAQVAALRESPDVNEAVRAYIQAGKRGLDLYESMKCAIEAALPAASSTVEG